MRTTTQKRFDDVANIIAAKYDEDFIKRADFIWQFKSIAQKNGYYIHYTTIERWQTYLRSQILQKIKKVGIDNLIEKELIQPDKKIVIEGEIYYHESLVKKILQPNGDL